MDFFEKKHHYPIHYVGNPTADEVRSYLASSPPSGGEDKPIIALLAGSRRQEIKDNLPAMIEAVSPYMNDYRVILAGAPGIDADYYATFVKGSGVEVVYNETYPLLAKAHAALVTSGTATLETALFNVPQVVCYKLPLPKIARIVHRYLIKVPYISLVNLIADREVVTELLADTFMVPTATVCSKATPTSPAASVTSAPPTTPPSLYIVTVRSQKIRVIREIRCRK